MNTDLELNVAARRLEGRVLGLVFGAISGAGLLGATLLLVVKGGNPVGPHLALLSQYLPGYTVTVRGSFLGLLYGFAGGYLIGRVIPWLYNAMTSRRSRSGKT